MKKKVTLFILSLFALLGTANAQGDVMPVDEVLMSIPSPLEISVLIKEVGAHYYKGYLSNPQTVSSYKTSFQQALNMGIYSVDLGYAHIYGKNQDAINYLNAIKKLTDNLVIGAYFDYNEVKKYAESSDKLEELVRETVVNFERINRNLREKKRADISILSLTGFWAETLYLTALLNKQSENDFLREKIGDQKLVLDKLLLVINDYNTKSDISSLQEDLLELKKVYDSIEIVVIKGEPIGISFGSIYTEPKDGCVYIEPKTEMLIVKVTDSHIEKITTQITNIRNKIINNEYK